MLALVLAREPAQAQAQVQVRGLGSLWRPAPVPRQVCAPVMHAPLCATRPPPPSSTHPLQLNGLLFLVCPGPACAAAGTEALAVKSFKAIASVRVVDGRYVAAVFSGASCFPAVASKNNLMPCRTGPSPTSLLCRCQWYPDLGARCCVGCIVVGARLAPVFPLSLTLYCLGSPPPPPVPSATSCPWTLGPSKTRT